MLSGPSFRPAFFFIINSVILSGFPLTSFHLAEAALFTFSWLLLSCVQLSKIIYSQSCPKLFKVVQNYLLLCVQLSKIIYNYSYFGYSFSNQSVLLAQLENVNKLWNNNCTVHVSEQNQNKNKTKSRHIQIDHAYYCSI